MMPCSSPLSFENAIPAARARAAAARRVLTMGPLHRSAVVALGQLSHSVITTLLQTEHMVHIYTLGLT